MSTKNLKFYKLNILKHHVGSSDRDLLGETKSKELINTFIEQHTSPLTVDKNNKVTSSTTSFPGYSSKIYMDVIKNNNDYLFATIGQKARANVQIRNVKSLTPSQINRKKDEIFEAYTYFIIDYKRMIITYASSQHSPNIKNLEKMFHQFDLTEGSRLPGFSQYDIVPEMIVEADAMQSILKEEMIYDISIDIASHETHVLSKIFPDTNLYLDLVDKGVKLDYKIVISKPKVGKKRKKPLGKVKEWISPIKQLSKVVKGSKVDSGLTLRTKTGDQLLQEFDLFDNMFTHRISWNIDPDKLMNRLQEDYDGDDEEFSSILMQEINDYTFNKLLEGYTRNIDRLEELARKLE